jgi:hypothetical protein
MRPTVPSPSGDLDRVGNSPFFVEYDIVVTVRLQGERSYMSSVIRTLALAPVLASLGACGGMSDSTPPGANVSASVNTAGGSVQSGTNGGGSGAPGNYTVGGTASGILGGGLILQLNGAGLPLAANGAFTFSDAIPSGGS